MHLVRKHLLFKVGFFWFVAVFRENISPIFFYFYCKLKDSKGRKAAFSLHIASPCQKCHRLMAQPSSIYLVLTTHPTFYNLTKTFLLDQDVLCLFSLTVVSGGTFTVQKLCRETSASGCFNTPH